MPNSRVLCAVVLLSCFTVACGKSDQTPPHVTATSPRSGDLQVDPETSAIVVTFSEPMQDNSWSWVNEDSAVFPKIAGETRFSEDKTTNILPVTLRPNTEYVIWINSSDYKGFKDPSGNEAVPYRIAFKTRSLTSDP
jgi:hypothetical protein